METTVTKRSNQKLFDIENFISFLEEEKLKGATHLKFYFSRDPLWAFEWVETIKIEPDPETDKQKIERLEKELEGLKNES